MELDEKKFISGFNAGYLLAEYEPQILPTVLKNIQPINSYISGMSFGKKEYELEQSQIRLNELEQLRQVSRGEKEKEQD